MPPIKTAPDWTPGRGKGSAGGTGAGGTGAGAGGTTTGGGTTTAVGVNVMSVESKDSEPLPIGIVMMLDINYVFLDLNDQSMTNDAILRVANPGTIINVIQKAFMRAPTLAAAVPLG